ncbi:MAG TPA: MFS transporter [Fimbriimonadales bacterium]|nr:MFS transporter [Fimbriimonadales bacterium]
MPQPDRLASLRALRTANLDLAFATAFAALVGGNFQQAFALELGATPRILALLAALPAIIGVLQIPGSAVGEHFRSYKSFVAVGAFLWRFSWVPIVLLPLAPAYLPRLGILIAVSVFSAVAIFLVQATYNAWLSFLVPESHRGWYFSRRIALATVVGAAVGFPASLALDWMDRHDDFTLGLSIIFGCGIACAAVSYFFYTRMPDTRRDEEVRASAMDSLRSLAKPMRDRKFIGLLAFLVVFVFGQTLASPFFFPYGRQVLKLDFLQLQVFAGFHAVASLLSAGMWGYFSDKYGNRPVLFISGLLLCLGPFGWALCNQGLGNWNMAILIVAHISAGFSWTGVAVAQGNIILANSPPELRAQAIGLSQAVIAGVSFLGQIVGGEFMQRTVAFLSPEMRYQWLFVINGVVRIGAVGMLFFVKDAAPTSIRGFLGQIARIRPKGVMAMRKLAGAETVPQRESAIRQLGTSGMTMAETELTRLLVDPSPRIRREAADALAKMGSDPSVEALVELVENHPLLVEEEMIDALASIGGRRAVSPLIALLENPSSALRRASARALGKLRSPTALQALIAAARNPDDAELRRAAVRALRQIGDPSCAPVIQEALGDPYPSVRIAAAEACADLSLAECAPMLRQILRNGYDEIAPEAAYALSIVGNSDDAGAVLDAAAKMGSVVGGKRCLLGAARLFGCEDRFYRLLMADPVAKDQALLHWSGANIHFKRSLSLFHKGDDQGALKHLRKHFPDKRIALVSEHLPPDGFLLAASILRA